MRGLSQASWGTLVFWTSVLLLRVSIPIVTRLRAGRPWNRCTQNCNYSLRYCAATSLQRGQESLATLEGGSYTRNMTSTGGCSYSFMYPDDGFGWHPKHVEWTCRIINRLLCVAFRWTIIDILNYPMLARCVTDITYLLHGAESFLRSQLACSQSRNSPHFTEPEGSLSHSQASATCLYPGPAQSSPYTHIPPPGDPS